MTEELAEETFSEEQVDQAPVEQEVQIEQPAQSPSFEQTNKLLQDHIELLRAQQEAKRPKAKEPEITFESDDDILTVGQAKKAFQEIQRANEELRVATRHKDYEEVITKYLPEAIKENPAIRTWIENSNSPYEQAYFLAKKSEAYLRDRVAQSRSEDANRLARNTKTSGNLSAVGSNSTARGTVDYKNMSQDDFEKVVARNMWG